MLGIIPSFIKIVRKRCTTEQKIAIHNEWFTKNRKKSALETGCHDWYDAKKKKMIIFDHEALFDLHRTELAANWK